MGKKEIVFLEQIKSILAKGNNAEVKQGTKGEWIVYEVRKKKTVVN